MIGKHTYLRIIPILIFISMILVSINIPIYSSKIETILSKIETTNPYPNSNIANLWVRPDGSEIGVWNYTPPFIANQTPLLGMTYFGTNVLLVTWEYLPQWYNSSYIFFPANCQIYVQIPVEGYLGCEVTADVAKYDSRIMGIFIDDFPVSYQSAANMSLMHYYLHHEDANLSVPRDLKICVIVYNYNYFRQTPNSWADIESYVDIINFWYVGWTYPLTWNVFAGYHDDFMAMHDILPNHEYWIGIYLHWYNLGQYPLKLTSEIMSIGGKLIKENYATQYSILENYWIQVHPETSEIVKNFINNQYQKNYTSTWYYPSWTSLSYQNNVSIYPGVITNLHGNFPETVISNYYILTSTALQNLTITGMNDSTFMLINTKTGEHEYGYWDTVNFEKSFILEPDDSYKIMNMPLTTVYVNGTLEITSSTTWSYKHYIINGKLYVNSSLEIRNSVIQFGNLLHNRTMYNNTYPNFGLILDATDAANLYIWDSIIEPLLKCYPYLFNRTQAWAGYNQEFTIVHSIISCYSDRIAPAGTVTIRDSTFFQVQPTGKETYIFGIRFNCAAYIMQLYFVRNLIFNYDTSGCTGILIMPYNLQYVPWPGTLLGEMSLIWYDNIIVGGNWGFWVDMTLSADTTFDKLTIYSECDVHSDYVDINTGATSNTIFVSFRLDGITTQQVDITTYTIFKWSVKGSTPSTPKLRIYWLEISNGIWDITHNNDSYSVGITTGTFFLIWYPPWNTHQDNFTLIQFSTFIDTEATISNLIWLLIFFLVPILMAQAVPKIGFFAGMTIMLFVFGLSDITFMPYMFMGLLAIGIYLYKKM